MKTTFDLPEDLVLQAKRVALSRKTTLRSLVLRGLEREIHHPSPEVTSPLHGLRQLETTLWEKTRPDEYVETLRSEWM